MQSSFLRECHSLAECNSLGIIFYDLLKIFGDPREIRAISKYCNEIY